MNLNKQGASYVQVKNLKGGIEQLLKGTAQNELNTILEGQDEYQVYCPSIFDRIKHINMLLSQFPEATAQDCFTPEEIKRLLYYAMPVRWRTNFINSGQRLNIL